MPATNPSSPKNPSTPPQSIPLRDLTRPPDTTTEHDGERRHTRGRSLLSGGSRSSTFNSGPRYERLGESSPSPPDRTPYRGAQPMNINTGAHASHEDHGTTSSPIENLADFQSAMGFAGLMVPDINVSPAPAPTHSHAYSFDSAVYDRHTPYVDGSDESSFFTSADSDRLPLTDPNSLAPISGSERSGSQSTGHNRSSSFQSVNFDTPESARRGSRLGDELRDPELGASPRSGRSRTHSYGMSLTPDSRRRSRSPSTSGMVSRAGSIVRAMSQRIVNLSGEAEMIEQSARRQAARSSRRASAISGSISEDPHSISSLSDEAEERFQTKHKDDPLAAGPNYRADLPTAPVEKAMRFLGGKEPERTWEQEPLEPPNPFRGKSLGIFSPDSVIRNKLCDLLVYPLTEPLILLLIVVQTVLLAVDASRNVFEFNRSSRWGESPLDYALLGLFVIFTLEIVARVIVSGFVMNAPEYSTRKNKQTMKEAIVDKYHTVFKPQRHGSVKEHRPQSFSAPDMIRSFTAKQSEAIRTVEQAQRLQLARRAFLRHGFNRLDFLAVIAFWIAFFLSWTQIENQRHLYIFRMLSCLRILRLLALTHGTAIILRSLKKATPMLLNVSFLIGFFWLIFAIVGVQSFKSSLDRQCVWVDPNDPTNATGSAFTNVLQFCGGQLNNETGAMEPFKVGTLDNLRFGAEKHKGYLCPRGSVCLELRSDQLPFNGTMSFDNIFQSLELVFVVMSGNTWSQLMYYMADSDYLAAALFFAGCIMIMLLWLINLLIAVITSSFQVIREEGKASAFAAQVKAFLPTEEGAEGSRRVNLMRRLYDRTYWFWIVVIAYGFVCQGFRSANIDPSLARYINNSEMAVTLVLLAEIILRFAVDWRHFIHDKKSWLDLALAVITSIILLPPIRNSGQPYAWLTVFQLLRIYRVIIAIPVTRGLITLVLGNSSGIANLVLFVFLITFLMSLLAVQLFRGELTPEDPYGETIRITYFTVWNAFIGMYQILSSEGWTESMYNLTAFNTARNTAWMAAVFLIGWFVLANFILVNMFIAVIQENFDVSEDEKRMHQVKAFLTRKELGTTSSNLSLSAVFRLGRSKAAKDPLDYGHATMEMLLKDAVVKDFLDDPDAPPQPGPVRAKTIAVGELGATPGFLSKMWDKIKSRTWNRDPNPFYTNVLIDRHVEESTDARTMAKEAVSASAQRKKAQREYLAKYPNYNTALFIFKPSNPLRRLCQTIVGPGRGSERFDGVEPNRAIWYAFSAFIYMSIVAMVILACITTPLYQKEYFETHGFHVRNWFVWADMAFAVIFTVEALIKVVADGLFWTPNAYFRSSWGFIDAVVLITFWINVITALSNDGSVSRAVGAFKALRALRLLNVSDSARDTFHSLIIVGGWKILSAMFVSLSLLLPFAIYGVNLFNGKMASCNDGSDGIATLADCFGEYSSNPASSEWDLLVPRVVSNPYYSFDDFGDSLFILFQIVSQEGWTDVMWQSMSITGRGNQPQHNASQGNAVFFIIFNLLSTVFILTLFISVFMRNYTEQTGVAFLTSDQRSWLELRKLLKQVSPSKRPSSTGGNKLKDWCYKRSVRKHGRWQRSVTLVLVLHLIILLIEYYPEPAWWNRIRDSTFLAFTVFYISNILIRLYGLSWARFRRSSWDLFSIFAVFGAFITSILLLSDFNSQVYIQLHKLFLVAIVLLLIPRNDALDQLFKTAAASLNNIGNLLATWFVLFLVYAIALTQAFGLTRFGGNEKSNYNFRTVPKALILLLSMSFGEGWNETMEDFAQIKPPLCVYGTTFFDSDCGSTNWARGLFITWNILSMYIFTSLFVSLIYESFSYVYQNSSGLEKVSREEIRRFKQAWATLDPDGTGFITKEQFPRLLGELSGVFEMRIYKPEDSVRNILEDVQNEQINARHMSMISLPSTSTGVNLKALNKRLAQIDPMEVRRSRARYNMFYEEVMVSADHDRGISFDAVLMILAHYNIISDNKSLRLEEFLRRRARLQRVEEQVRRRVVLGFFDTMYHARQLKKYQERKRSGYMTDIPQLGPEVFVDDVDVSKQHAQSASATLLSPLDLPTTSPFLAHGMESAIRNRSDSLGGSPGPSPGLSPHRPANSISGYSFDGTELIEPPGSGNSTRRNSAISNENVLDVLDNSAWGDSIRRSFTTKRPDKRGSSS